MGRFYGGMGALLEFFIIPMLAVHLLLVNVASAGPFVCVWLEWRETNRGDKLARSIGRRLAEHSAWSLLMAVVLGALLVGVLWLRGDSNYFRAVQILPRSRLWFALAELAFSLTCLVAYWKGWNWFKKRRGWHRTLAVLAGSNLLYHFPPLFSLISVACDRPEWWGQTMTSAEFRGRLLDAAVLSRSLHVWLASFAVVGSLLLMYALQAMRHEPANAEGTRPHAARVAGWGAWLALVPSLLQLLVGVWVLLEVPEPRRNLLFGDSWWITAVFVVSMLAALRMLHVLAMIVFGERDRRPLIEGIGTMVLTVVLMTGVLHQMRRATSDFTTTAVIGSLDLSKGISYVD